MARPPLTDAAVDTFRRRAIEVAMRLFAEDGYDAFSLRTLARELGVSHTTPYRYFDGKGEIFSIARAESFRRFGAFLRQRLEASNVPADRLRILARAYFDFAKQQSVAFRLAFELGQREEEDGRVVDEAAAEAWAVLVSVVAEAVHAGELDGEPEVIAHTLWAGIHGVAALELAGRLRRGRGAKALLETMTEALISAHQGAPRTKKQTKKRARR
jgi:AcrR family transcriptional regulator